MLMPVDQENTVLVGGLMEHIEPAGIIQVIRPVVCLPCLWASKPSG